MWDMIYLLNRMAKWSDIAMSEIVKLDRVTALVGIIESRVWPDSVLV